jgi:hypothetical protein
MSNTLADVLEEARQTLESEFRWLVEDLQPQGADDLENLTIEHHSRTIDNIAASSVPGYTHDLLMLALNDLTLAFEVPECAGNENSPYCLLTANVYSRIERDLHEYWQDLVNDAAYELTLEDV